MAGDSAPFIEELTEEEFSEKMSRMSPDEELPIDANEVLQIKIMRELDAHQTLGKSAYEKGNFEHSYDEYKTGLRACSDLINGSDVKDDPKLKATYLIRRRKFCINAAAACIKIAHWQQGLEACTLLLEEGADNDMQRQKALYRSGVCARGMGELDAASDFFNKLMDEGEENLDESTLRSVKAQLKGVAEEKKRYKKFAREMCNPTKDKNLESIILPEKKELSEEELEKLAEVEARREQYLNDKKKQKEDEENKGSGGFGVSVKSPDIMMSEEDCISVLDELAESYSKAEVQKALKEATLDHEVKFSTGFIIRSKKILAPLQQDILLRHGYLNTYDVKEDVPIANTKAHDEALRKFQHTVRYLAKSNKHISEKAELCQRLAFGDVMMGSD